MSYGVKSARCKYQDAVCGLDGPRLPGRLCRPPCAAVLVSAPRMFSRSASARVSSSSTYTVMITGGPLATQGSSNTKFKFYRVEYVFSFNNNKIASHEGVYRNPAERCRFVVMCVFK